MMAAMSIPVSCVGVKTHVFMNDLVVDGCLRRMRGSFPRDFPWIYDGWSSDQP
jgi:hypothetical protein